MSTKTGRKINIFGDGTDKNTAQNSPQHAILSEKKHFLERGTPCPRGVPRPFPNQAFW